MTKSNSQQLPVIAIFLGIFTAFLWALWPVVSRFSILQSLSSNDVAMLRFWVAGLILLPYLLKKGWGGLSLRQIIFLAATSGMLYVFLALSGLNYAPSGHAGMIIPSSTMVFAFIGSWLVLGDKPQLQRIIGMAIIIMAIIFANYFSQAIEIDSNQWRGHLLFMAAGLCWGSYSVAAQRAKLAPLHMTAIVSVVSMIVMTPLYFLFGNPTIFQAELNEILIQGVFQGVIVAILALYIYTKTIELLGPSRTALFVSLVPGFTALIAYPILAEVPTNMEIVGLVVVTIGMVVALRSD